MAVEIIRRKEGELSQKQDIRHEKTQVSINDWGHLVIRCFDTSRVENDCLIGTENCTKEDHLCWNISGYRCENYKSVRTDDEHLVVFNQTTTNRIIDFVNKQNPSYEFMQFLKEMAKKKVDDFPF